LFPFPVVSTKTYGEKHRQGLITWATLRVGKLAPATEGFNLSPAREHPCILRLTSPFVCDGWYRLAWQSRRCGSQDGVQWANRAARASGWSRLGIS